MNLIKKSRGGEDVFYFCIHAYISVALFIDEISSQTYIVVERVHPVEMYVVKRQKPSLRSTQTDLYTYIYNTK